MLKKTVIITLITILMLIIARIAFIDSVTISGRSTEYLGNYKKYYLCKKEFKPFSILNLPGAGSGKHYKVWFLLGQKQKCLNKIKEDVNTELKKIVANNSDIIKDYEIGDNFAKIYIYYYKGKMDARGYRLEEPAGRIILKVELYHQLVKGYTSFYGDILNDIELEDEYNPEE